MSKFKALENGFLIEKKFLYGAETPQKDYINLSLKIGNDMRYDKIDLELVDYPGEYDIDGITINAYLGKGDTLSYMISYDGEKIGIIGSDDVLNLDEVGGAQTRYYTDEKISNKIDQLELEGEKIKLEKESN